MSVSGLCSSRKRQARLAGLATWVVVALLGPTSSRAESPEDLAVRASAGVDLWCSDAAMMDPARQGEARSGLIALLQAVHEQVEADAPPWLRAWRARLSTCLGQTDWVSEDYKAALASQPTGPAEAARELARAALGSAREAAPPAADPASPGAEVVTSPKGFGFPAKPTAAPAQLSWLRLGFGFGWSVISTSQFLSAHGEFELRLGPSPLHAVVGGGVGLSLPQGDGGNVASFLPTLELGVALRPDGLPLQPELGVLAGMYLGVERETPFSPPNAVVRLGPLVRGALNVPFGRSAVALRVAGELGTIPPHPVARVTVMVVFGR